MKLFRGRTFRVFSSVTKSGMRKMMRNGLIMESALSVREKLFSIRILWATTPLLRIIVCKARNIVQEIDRVLDWNINNYALRIFVYHSPRVFHSFDESTSLCKDVSRLFYNILQKSEKKEEDFKEWRKKNDEIYNRTEDDGPHRKNRQINRVRLEFKTPCIGNHT